MVFGKSWMMNTKTFSKEYKWCTSYGAFEHTCPLIIPELAHKIFLQRKDLWANSGIIHGYSCSKITRTAHHICVPPIFNTIFPPLFSFFPWLFSFFPPTFAVSPWLFSENTREKPKKSRDCQQKCPIKSAKVIGKTNQNQRISYHQHTTWEPFVIIKSRLAREKRPVFFLFQPTNM